MSQLKGLPFAKFTEARKAIEATTGGDEHRMCMYTCRDIAYACLLINLFDHLHTIQTQVVITTLVHAIPFFSTAPYSYDPGKARGTVRFFRLELQSRMGRDSRITLRITLVSNYIEAHHPNLVEW